VDWILELLRDWANSSNALVRFGFCIYLGIAVSCWLYILFQLVAVEKESIGSQNKVEAFLVGSVFMGLCWPIWAIIKLSRIATSPAHPKSATAPQGFPVQVQTSQDESRCSECCRQIGNGNERYVWRGNPVCRSCRDALSVLDA
jgi:hypothetical protein